MSRILIPVINQPLATEGKFAQTMQTERESVCVCVRVILMGAFFCASCFDRHFSLMLLKHFFRCKIEHFTSLFCLCFLLACDDECSGLLISDMDRLYRIITDVTLTTPLPPPYKLLYRFENMTEELKVMFFFSHFCNEYARF